jgi:hypothetical protein
MKRVIPLLIPLLLICNQLQAEDLTVSWTVPTRTQSCVDAGELTNAAGYKFYSKIAEVTDPTQSSVVIPALKPGDYEIVAVTYTDTGQESFLSNPTVKTVTEFVTTEVTVYYAVQQPERFLLLPVGTVPIGTTCDPDTSVNGFYSVPPSEVTSTGTVTPMVVLAKCG